MQPYPQDGMAMQHMLMHGGGAPPDGQYNMPQFQGGMAHHAGQFPQGHYNNPQGQSMQRASLIQRRKDKEDKQKRKEELIELKRKEEKKDAGINMLWLLGMGIVHTLALCIVIVGNSWCHKSFKGIGIKILTVRTSLFMIEIDIQCGKNWLEDKLCVVGKQMNGEHSLHQGAQIACTISQQACRPVEEIRHCSLIIFFTFGIAIIVQIFAVIFLYSYWYQQHVPRLKKGAMLCFAASPAIAGIGLLTWSMVVPNLQDVPKGWSAMSSIATGTSLFAFKEVHSFPFGWTWFAAIVVLISMSVWLAFWPAMFKKHEGEEEAAEEEDRLKDMLEHEYMVAENSREGLPGPSGFQGGPQGGVDSTWGGAHHAADGTWASAPQPPPGVGFPGGMQQPPPGVGGMEFGLPPTQQHYGYHQQ